MLKNASNKIGLQFTNDPNTLLQEKTQDTREGRDCPLCKINQASQKSKKQFRAGRTDINCST